MKHRWAAGRLEQQRGLSVAGVLHGAVIGLGLGILAAYLGEVRTPVSLLLGMVLICAVMGAFPFTHRLLTGASFVVLAVLGVCLLTPVLRGPLASLTVSQTPVKADAIVILGGGVWCDSRAPDTASLSRLVKGLELWQAGYASVVTVSEQSGLIGPPDCVKLSDMQRQTITRLYPTAAPDILTLNNVTTTRDEAARVRDYARARGWTRILLVTSPSHSRRAQAIFQQQGVNAISVPAPETRYDPSLPLPFDRLAALRTLMYEGLSRLKALVGGTPER